MIKAVQFQNLFDRNTLFQPLVVGSEPDPRTAAPIIHLLSSLIANIQAVSPNGTLAIYGELSDGTSSTRPNTVSVYLREALLPTQLLALAKVVIIYSITSIYHSISFLARLHTKVEQDVRTTTSSLRLEIPPWIKYTSITNFLVAGFNTDKSNIWDKIRPAEVG